VDRLDRRGAPVEVMAVLRPEAPVVKGQLCSQQKQGSVPERVRARLSQGTPNRPLLLGGGVVGSEVGGRWRADLA
jgi:hypothetical protein